MAVYFVIAPKDILKNIFPSSRLNRINKHDTAGYTMVRKDVLRIIILL